MGRLITVCVSLCCSATLPAQGLFKAPDLQTALSTPFGGVHVGDYDQDGVVDFAVGSDLYLGDGSGGFVPTTIRPPVAVFGAATGPIAVEDIDQDGDLDFVYVDGLWINGGGTYTDETATRIGATLSPGANIALVYDADNDGDLDLVAVYIIVLPGGYKFLYLETAINDGTGNFPTASSRYLAGGTGVIMNGVLSGDFDGNGVEDFAISGAWYDQTSWGSFGGAYLGSGSLKAGSNVIGGRGIAAAADVNGDGIDDILASDYSGTVAFLGGVTPVPISGDRGGVYVADFDGDGIVDCLSESSLVANQFTLNINSGAATFTSSTLSIPASVVNQSMAVGDLDRDGDADVVLSDPPRVLRNARQQLTAPATVSLAGTVPFAVDAVDVSGPLAGFAQIAVSLVPIDMPLGRFGVLLIDPAQLFLLPLATVVAGQGTASFTIPNVPALVGMDLFAQALIDDGMRLHLSNRTRTLIQ
tara:strand:- start:1760 stop:3175 length:1416 start_codon:yes stop_codon:yes gene_type:complete